MARYGYYGTVEYLHIVHTVCEDDTAIMDITAVGVRIASPAHHRRRRVHAISRRRGHVGVVRVQYSSSSPTSTSITLHPLSPPPQPASHLHPSSHRKDHAPTESQTYSSTAHPDHQTTTPQTCRLAIAWPMDRPSPMANRRGECSAGWWSLGIQ